MIGYPRFPVLEMHLGKFPDLLDFQAGMSTSRQRSAQSQLISNLTMQRIKEVEMENSTDELISSRPITGRTVPMTAIC